VTWLDSVEARASGPAVVGETPSELEAVTALHVSNAAFVRGLGGSGVAWYREHLCDDFVCTLATGGAAAPAGLTRGTIY
jgi:hypothetical protein